MKKESKMKLSSNSTEILQCLCPGNGDAYHLSAREIRIRTGLSPMKLMAEIRALINLRFVSTHGDGIYRITESGKAAIIGSKKKEIKDGEIQELFK